MSVLTFFEIFIEILPVFKERVTKEGGLRREFSSKFKPTFYPCSFSPSMPTPRGRTQLPLARYRLHCILQNEKGIGRQLHCLRLLRSSRQMDRACKNLQLTDRTVLIKTFDVTVVLKAIQNILTVVFQLQVSTSRGSFKYFFLPSFSH